MKTILVPVDFSSYSDNALDFAYALAKRDGDAKIMIMHIIEAMDTQSYSTMGMVKLDNQTDLDLNLMIQGVQKRMQDIVNNPKFDGIEIVAHVHHGKPYENISKAIAEHEATVVVMGTLGSSGLDELFIGSNTEKVVRFAKCPVLSIPESAKFDKIKNVVYATNLKEEDDDVVQRLKYGLTLFGAHLHLLWVNTIHDLESVENMDEKLNEFAQKNGLSNYSVHVSKGIFAEAGIMNYADEIDADMIAMTTGGKKGIAYLFSGSLAEDVVNHSSLPVWTYSVRKDK
jgi:nucleotide-binding universal stress UspA family protein